MRYTSARMVSQIGPAGVALGDIDLDGAFSLVLDADGDSKIYANADDDIYFTSGGSLRMRYNNNDFLFAKPIRVDGQRVYDNSAALNLGTSASTSHALSTGDALVGGALEVDGDFYFDGTDIHVPAYSVDYVIPAGAAILGPTAPTFEVNGLAGGLGFNADAEAVYLNFEVPSSWDGTSDLKLKVYWVAESGDVPQLNETVKWDFEYRSIIFGTEDADNGTSVTATTTYTETADPGDDQDTHVTEITLDFDDVNQPLTAGDTIIGRFDRDVTTDTYSGLGIVNHWEVEVQEDKLLRDHI